MPAVTVLMSVFNGMPYLPEAVDSILNQTLRDFVFFIVDDGSTDTSAEYLGLLDDPRVRLMHQPQEGLGSALNKGLALCETEFLARMDADDVSHPSRLEAQLGFLQSHVEVGMVGTQFAYCGPGGRTVSAAQLPCDHTAIYADLFHGQLSFIHASFMCRAPRLRRIGGYGIEGLGEDWDMLLRLGELTQLANLDQELYRWRMHRGNFEDSHLAELSIGIEYGCDCARRRASGRSELTFDEFLLRQIDRRFSEPAVDAMNRSPMVQCRRAMAEILSSQRVPRGIRVVWEACCSPARTAQRIFGASTGAWN